jgi:hypothetical protein
MKFTKHLDEARWREFVMTHPQGGIFHAPEMYQVFARVKKHKPDIWAVLSDDDRILSLFTPVQLSVLDGFLRRFSTRAVAYGGVLAVQTDEGNAALDLLFSAYAGNVEGVPVFTELRNLVDVSNLQTILQRNNYHFEGHLNYLINLNLSPEEIMQNIGARTRKNLRRALRAGNVIVEEVTDRAGLDECYQLLVKTYSLAEVPLADKSLFEAAFDVLYPKNMIRVLMARVDGTPAATSFELLYKDVMYGWYGGLDRTYAEHLPNEVLMWHILEWGANHGYKTYDFGGAGKPDEEYGVRDFKAKFGGTLVNYGRNTCVHAPLALKFSEFGYSLLRKFL